MGIAVFFLKSDKCLFSVFFFKLYKEKKIKCNILIVPVPTCMVKFAVAGTSLLKNV